MTHIDSEENRPTAAAALRFIALLASCALLAACSDDPGGPRQSARGSTSRAAAEMAPGASLFAASSIVSSPETQTGYVHLLSSLMPGEAEVDLKNAREFPGPADMWVHDGAIFVSGGEAPTVTKFTVAQDGALVESEPLSFVNQGLQDSAFWNNTFVSADKAYMINDVGQYIIWDPSRMLITGTLDLPPLPARRGFLPRAGSSDRATLLHGTRLFQPMYWSDESYADRPDDSKIIVIDTEQDRVIDVLDAPCPGLDFGTADDNGNLYFSNWTGGVGAHLVLGTAPNCVVKVEAQSLELSVALRFAEVTGGHEGAAFRHAGAGRFVFSVFREDNVEVEADADPFELISGLDWQLYGYDPATGATSEIAGVGGNSGAVYWFEIGGSQHALVPSADYGASTVYALAGSAAAAERKFELQGYAIRLFQLR